MIKSNDNTAVTHEIFADKEYAPDPVRTLKGGDGEGLYVIPRRYVEIEAGPGHEVRLTPSQARQMAAELLNAADQIEVAL